MKQTYDHLRPGLRAKIDQSISLLRKTESIALKYDPQDGFYLAFSGGKDSQTLYHVAQLAGVKFKAHMMLTSIDPPEVILFVKRNYPDVVLHPPKDSIYNMAVKRRLLLPSRLIRWCCAELKEMGGAGTVCLTGIRKEESLRRSKRNEMEISNRSFSGSFDEFVAFSNEKIKEKVKNLNQDEFAEQGVSSIRCVNGKDKIITNPLLDWSEEDVWDFLNGMGIEHCSLYDNGWKRIGCICCPMANYKSKIDEIKRYPYVKRNWINTIKKIRNDETIKNMLTQNDFGGRSEDENCENIFYWWISGKSYDEWYAESIQQLKINFNE